MLSEKEAVARTEVLCSSVSCKVVENSFLAILFSDCDWMFYQSFFCFIHRYDHYTGSVEMEALTMVDMIKQHVIPSVKNSMESAVCVCYKAVATRS